MADTVLVVGAGQVGTFAAGALEESGARVIAADSAPASGFFSRFSAARHAELVELDMLDRRAVRALLERERVDAVVLAAGLVGARCADEPRRAWAMNVDAARDVAEAAIEAGASRVVLISSLAVYGRPNADRIDETFALRPESEYGRTKAAAEAALSELAGAIDLRVLRPCGVYGPLRLRGGSHSARFIEAAMMAATRTGKVTIRAGGDTGDQYLYVRDLGRAIATAATAALNGGSRTFNVAPGTRTTAHSLAEAIRAAVPGTDVEIVGDGEGKGEELRPSMPPLDASAIERTLGFTPGFSLEDGLADYVHTAGFAR